MPRGYHHLTYSQRCQLSVLNERGESISEIARTLGVHRSTISRELERNSQDGIYHYDTAQGRAEANRQFSHAQTISSALFDLMKEKLELRWSPTDIGVAKEKQ